MTYFVGTIRSAVVHPRRLRSVVLTAIQALLVAGWITVRPAGAQGELHVVSPGDKAKVVFADANGDGLGLGDGLTARGPLLDADGATVVGTAYLECTVMRRITGPSSGLFRCSYLLELAAGDLVLEGLDPRGTGTHSMAVLGGTRAYADASGSATLTDTASETDIVITLG